MSIDNFVISHIIENSSDFQYCVSFDVIEQKFNILLTENEVQSIYDSLSLREEIADITIEKDCFDVVMYTKYIQGC